uniref:Uncharacterized protein n=1 Tax=Anguilla anguilla TaxID=7936 RepID=A0A0E9S4D9_ANGAN
MFLFVRMQDGWHSASSCQSLTSILRLLCFGKNTDKNMNVLIISSLHLV